ncbi:hypothetical protein JVU11DRAFT_9124 [Chiua virens]|nr:hypothetical protein JVU11DRAFT_9124 [Chiua virens]
MYTFFESESRRVFTSPNTPHALPTTILPRIAPGDWSDILTHISKIRWMSAEYPHIPYAMRRPLSGVPLFSCLYDFDNTKHIVHSNGRFSLRSDLLEKWVQLDTFLTQVFEVLPAGDSRVQVKPVPSDANYAVSWR